MKTFLILSVIFIIILNEDKNSPKKLKDNGDNKFEAEKTISTNDFVTLT